MDNEARILLDDVIAYCRRDGRDARLINMLEQIAPTALTDEELALQAPNRFAASYLERQREVIEAYLEEITFAPMRLNVLQATTPGGTGGAAAGRATPSTRTQREQNTEPTAIASVPGTAPAPGTQQSVTPYSAEVTGAAPAQPTNTTSPAGAPQTAVSPVTLPSTPTTTAVPAEAPLPAPNRGFSVKNTLSPEEFRRLMADMNGAPAPASAPTRGQASPTSAMQTAEPVAVDINSKYTFENFVYGDENRHAYQSAMRFAALAEEPGQCPSLFIYGNSGLGKTHLLFAVKNYLVKECPHLRVKYANSQAYFEDYLRELGIRDDAGGPGMREYHDADVLIIDDIQQIVNKQQTVENFFRLMDEFIRSGKKIAIASDRPPKHLDFDERLTSRFNAGMLCLVSPPGFEMKYHILARYYENVIQATGPAISLNAASSLLTALPATQGHLTDDHLRHMAEISGNNIRELEGFCERCADLSSERELEGRELTFEDIDGIADQFFETTSKVVRIGTVQRVVEEYYNISHEDLIGPRRQSYITWPRHVAVYLANSLCEMTTPAIGAEFGGRDHSTVLNSLKAVEKKMKADRTICEELQQVKNKIILAS